VQQKEIKKLKKIKIVYIYIFFQMYYYISGAEDIKIHKRKEIKLLNIKHGFL